MLAIEAQASMYQMTGLLIAHRVLNPIGTLDNVASSYANSIRQQYLEYSHMVGPGARLHHVTFPNFVAALEIPHISKGLWQQDGAFSSVAPNCVGKMLALIEYVWIKRYQGSESFLFDLIDSGPGFVVVP